MTRSSRKADNGRRSWVAGISVLLLVAVLGAGLRLIGVEATVPPRIWLDELRPLDTNSGDRALTGAAFRHVLESVVADPSFVHDGYAACVQDLKLAETSGEDAIHLAALQDCLAVVDRALRAAPARSELWLERARLLLLLDGSQEEVFRALRVSYRTGPREGWIAVQRIPIALRLWESLPDDLRSSVREDIRLAMSKSALIASIASLYMKDFSIRTTLVSLLEDTSELSRQRFLEEVKRLQEMSVRVEAKESVGQNSTSAKSEETNAKSAKLAKVEVTAGGEAYQGYPIYRLLADGVPVGSAVAGAVTFNDIATTDSVRADQIRKSLATSSFVVPDIDQIGSLEIEFLNDDWAGQGKPGDRNLWISQVSVNGYAYPAVRLHIKADESLEFRDGMAVLFRNGSAILTRPDAGWAR